MGSRQDKAQDSFERNAVVAKSLALFGKHRCAFSIGNHIPATLGDQVVSRPFKREMTRDEVQFLSADVDCDFD